MGEEAAIGLVEPLRSVTGTHRDRADRPGRRRRGALTGRHRAGPPWEPPRQPPLDSPGFLCQTPTRHVWTPLVTQEESSGSVQRAVGCGHVYGLRCGSSHAAGPDGSSRIRSNSMPRARSALSRSGFPDPVSSTGAPSSPSTYLRLQQPHSHECLRSRDRSSVDSSFRHQGPDHTGHLVGQRHPDQHWRLAGQHAGHP
jgi:hypothetical protein